MYILNRKYLLLAKRLISFCLPCLLLLSAVNGATELKKLKNKGASGSGPSHRNTVAQAIPYRSSFEKNEGFKNRLRGDGGWSEDVGRGTSRSHLPFEAHSGSQYLYVEEGKGNWAFSQLSLGLIPSAGESVVFIDVYIRPEVINETPTAEILDIEGSLIAFESDNTATGHIRLFDGNGRGGGEWVTVPPELPLVSVKHAKVSGDFSADYIKVTIRQDYRTHSYDVWINGVLTAIDFGQFDDTVSFLENISIISGKDESIVLDDLSVTLANPLFADADKDGISDDLERSLGLDPYLDDRNTDADNDGLTAIEEIIKGTHPRFNESRSASPIIYVDCENGDDNCEGLHAFAFGGTQGPKASISSALNAAPSGSSIIVLAGTYTESILDVADKDLFLDVSLGNVIINASQP